MVTKQQAMVETNFHENGCSRTEGPRGGVKTDIRYWRANGACKTWKTLPEDFQLPIKRGLKSFGYLHEYNANEFHAETDCPLLKELKIDPNDLDSEGL